MSQTSYIRWPFGAAEKTSVAFAAVMAATINNSKTVLTLAQMTAAATLNLTINSEMEVGAELIIKVSVDGTNRVLTHGTGFTGAATTLTASKSYCLTYVYDGSTYLLKSTQLLN